MHGLVSFHAIDPAILDEVAAPLIAGGKVQPDGFLDEAVRFRRNGWHASRYAEALASALEGPHPPEPATGGRLIDRMRSGLDRLRHRPDPRAERIRAAIDVDLHLVGRPFLVTEGSADRVADRVGEFLDAPSGEAAESLALEQVARLGPEIVRGLEPEAGTDMEPEFNYRRDVLEHLRTLFDLPRAARTGEAWRPPGGAARPATDAVASDLAWSVAAAHGRVRPFWIARDVDGLETVCRAAGVPPPAVLVPAWRLTCGAVDEFPGVREALGTEIPGPRAVGGFVAPEDVAELIAFLVAEGARVIQAAARHGEGPRCATLLRKIRECATWAEARGFGYLEASGITPPYLDPESLPGDRPETRGD